jgi:hypothetical protein
MLIPYTSGYVVLCGVQALVVGAVREPPSIPVLRRHALFGLIPLVGIGGVVVVVSASPSLAQRLVDVSVVATPLLALLGVVSLRVRLLAVLTPVAYLAAWRGGGRPADTGVDLLVALACVTLAWLTGLVAPRVAISVGIVIATIVDVYQVLFTTEVRRVSQALSAAAPPAGLPHLQEAVFAGASMGWGDVYLAALLGVVVAGQPVRCRVEAMIVVFAVGLVEGFGFRVVDTLPATVPVAVALGVSLRHRETRRATLQGSQGGFTRWRQR